MNLISVVNFIGETELVRADQIESIGLPVKDRSKETYIHGWVRLISGRAIGFAEGEAEKFVESIKELSRRSEASVLDQCSMMRGTGTPILLQCLKLEGHAGDCKFTEWKPTTPTRTATG